MHSSATSTRVAQLCFHVFSETSVMQSDPYDQTGYSFLNTIVKIRELASGRCDLQKQRCIMLHLCVANCHHMP